MARTLSRPPSGLARSARAFRHRDFRVFWLGALASNSGTWLTNLAVPFVLYDLTRSAFWVGLASLAQFLPGVLLAPAGGAIADRYERRRVLLGTQAGMALSSAALWLVWVTGLATPAAIMVLVAVAGAFAGVNLPSWQSFVNDLVPREDLASAVALNSLQFNAARSIGPAVAGVLLATLGPAWAFGLNAVSFLFVLVALLLVRRRVRPGRRSGREGVLRGFAVAVRYARRQPGVRVAIGVSILVGFLGNPLFTLTVVFASDVFHVGAVGLGLMNTALGVGAVLAAPAVAGARTSLTRARVTGAALLLYAGATIVFGVARDVVVGSLALLVIGGCYLAVISSANTAIQMIVTERLRGRVLAVRIMFLTARVPAGAVLQGWLVDRVGPHWTVAGAGVALGVVAVLFTLPGGRLLLARLERSVRRVPHGGTLRYCFRR